MRLKGSPLYWMIDKYLSCYYTYYEDEMGYLTSLNDSAYVLITANKADIEAIVARFTLSLAD